MQNIEIGISMIIFGTGVVIFMTKRPPSYPLTSVNFQGYAGGIAFILLGVICILKELHLL
ncbi:hypothetical protein SAMN05444484_10167 [Flavobacterium chilense]|uniref:Uncharacterized protein n=1 Tax=Flavobacterium chilense TaxID=946677 RepID=A0A1M6XAY0_9FLAO|nr:hypothetical protein SAMN05444484_10167 [Flavobacterium chilense]